ncbi:tetratricopeptide repeat protein [Pseudorhodobacter sp.]|uniref:tetratricopeptide repeat protein n=1 Tax=Pseudorhodobacter sp. TaxID=1934400 RepID=UPI00264A225C|nr:tetratricopeptide repeat protein [Pseudorhodobacter sp.]MDN5785523.1 tetratricopeptide repeat protein [Pseudorhodobacter sp.]
MPFRPTLAAAALAICAQPALLRADTATDTLDPGAYLAARVAGDSADYHEAAHWYSRALIATPGDADMMAGAIIAQLGLGNIDAAIEVAKRLAVTGTKSQPAELALIADEAKREDYAALLKPVEGGRTGALLLDGLIEAWAELGAGSMTEALDAFDRIIKTKGLESFGQFHKALALATAGDFEGAEKLFGDAKPGSIMSLRRATIAHIQILSQLDRTADALTLLDKTFQGEGDPSIAAMRAQLIAGKPVPFDIIRNATDGLAEVFFTLAVALNGEASDGFTLQYARIATYLRPGFADAILLVGAMLENQKQYDLATEAYATVPPDDGGFYAAEIGRARALQAAGKLDAALEVLRGQIRSNPKLMSLQLALADMLRGAERWPEATEAYNAAIALIPQPATAGYWAVYYSRAITLERQKLWDKAEPDFRKALELEPDQPQVLNYLGYSYLERGENYDEALSMIQRAVAQRPDSGYIIDSLAWGYFLAGRYADAVEPMEHASLLEPVDPTVTDHLGDVYWAVDRKLEARFQWRRALSFNPEEALATRLRRKLEIGLDAVLKEEGAKSLADVANDK